METAGGGGGELKMADDEKPRLCRMAKGENGYGFHLHGEKGKSGQYIRKVEPASAAEAAGLRAGDRVVQVNGDNVEKETHHQVSSHLDNRGLLCHMALPLFLCVHLTVLAGCIQLKPQVNS